MKIGIVGAGAIARRAHLPTYSTMVEAEVVGIADINESLVSEVAREFNIPRYVSSCEELLQDDSIQLVDICTPPHTHLAVIKLAAERRKNILVEKPLALSLRDALCIQELIERNGVKLCAIYNWRYASSVLIARERLLKGYLGNVVTIHGLALTGFPTGWTLNTWPYHGGGTLYDVGPHLIDLILFLKNFARIKTIYASGGDFSQGNMDFINYAVLTIEFQDASIATADISWVTGAMYKLNLEIYGDGGTMILDVRNDVLAESHGYHTPFDDIRLFSKKMWKIGRGVVGGDYFKGANLYYKPLIQDFINAINGNGEIPISITQAIMTNAVLEAAEKSIRQKQPVSFEGLFGSESIER
jgi:predicted dehydrogenase